MPLYSGAKDVGFLRGISMELMHQIISSEILIFKISQQSTAVNIYGEATDRRYKPGVRVYTRAVAEDKIAQNDSEVVDFNKNIIFSFLKADLKNQGIYIEVGDIIMYDDQYFEIDNVNDGKYWSNRNPNSNIGMMQNNWALHGYDYTIICETHQTQKTVLNIEEDLRDGEPIQDYIEPSIPKYL